MVTPFSMRTVWFAATFFPVVVAAQAASRKDARDASSPDTLAVLAAGGGTTCVTTTEGAGYCWGDLGETRGTPYRILGADGRPVGLRSLSTWASSCGLADDGDVLCGRGLTGGWIDSAGAPISVPESCGYGTCIDRLPIRGPLPAAPLREVTTGLDHACALALNGAAYCWGNNRMGQLGNGTWAPTPDGSTGKPSRAPTPVVAGLRFSQISAGEMLTCGVTQPDAAVYCWGYGQDGQTGDSAATTHCSGEQPYYNKPCSTAVPARVLPETLPGQWQRPAEVRFERVDAGMRLACAIATNGDVYCWGSNYRCALGRCREPGGPRARRVSMPGRAVEIGAGYRHACARTADRRVFCWGDNTAGQLGSLATANAGPDGLPPDYRDTTDRVVTNAAYREDPCFLGGRCSPAPVEVSAGRRWAALAVGTDHACALAEDDGGVYCWGGSEAAPLGLGARFERCENRSSQWKDVRCQPRPVRVPGLPSLASPPLPPARRAQAGESSELTSTRVLVSRREVRVIFPRDTSRAWGWSERTDLSYDARYTWGMSVEGVDGPRILSLSIYRTHNQPRDFPSLRSLVAAARAELCRPGMFATPCPQRSVSAGVEGGRVVLTLRDSAMIGRLFGVRPRHVRVWQHRPEEEYRAGLDSVRVEYVAPFMPQPSTALRAAAARGRRAYEASITSISRYIRIGEDHWGEVAWLAVGDSAEAAVEEMHCHYDSCVSGMRALSDSGWSVADTSIASIRPAARPTPGLTRRGYLSGGPEAVLTARRVGRTVVRVRGLHGASDTTPTREPPQRALERAVVVTLPVARVEIVPRRDTLRLGEVVEFRVRATDRSGQTLAGLPADLTLRGADYVRVHREPTPMPVTFDRPGRWTLVARLGARADTLVMTVVEPAKK